jgi:hypothetical protein
LAGVDGAEPVCAAGSTTTISSNARPETTAAIQLLAFNPTDYSGDDWDGLDGILRAENSPRHHLEMLATGMSSLAIWY